MKRILLVIMFIIVVMNLNAREVIKKRIAVMEFTTKRVEPDLGCAISEILITELVGIGEFIVLERAQIDKVYDELNLQNSDDFNDEFREKLGDLYGAELIIVGDIIKLGSNITINIRGVQTATGIIEFAKKIITEDINKLPGLLQNTALIISGKATSDDYESIKDEKNLLPQNKFARIAKPMRTAGSALTGLGVISMIGGFACLGVQMVFSNYGSDDMKNYLPGIITARNALLIAGSISLGLGIGFWIVYGIMIYKARHYKQNTAFYNNYRNNKVVVIPDISTKKGNDLALSLHFLL